MNMLAMLVGSFGTGLKVSREGYKDTLEGRKLCRHGNTGERGQLHFVDWGWGWGMGRGWMNLKHCMDLAKKLPKSTP
jgi:hypothetical protein